MLRIFARAHTLDGIETILDQEFEGLEISLPCRGGAEEERAWGRWAAERGVALLGHGPNEGDPRNLAHLAEKTLPKFREALEAAQRLGAATLTLHFNVDSRWLPPETVSGKIGLLRRIAGWGAELGIQVNLENLSESSADLGTALDEVPGLGLTLDVGHAMLTHRTSTAPAIIDELFDRIGHLHLHDNRGGKSPRDDLHLIPGDGEVDFLGLFRELKKRGYGETATLELAPHEMALARERVRDSWERAG